MQDIIDADSVDITVDSTGKIWVNVDGKCVLRIGHAKAIEIDDPYRGADIVYEDEHADTG